MARNGARNAKWQKFFMPSLQKFHANVARHIRLMDKNLCANLIRHEYIVTTQTRAKRASKKINSFLANALRKNSAPSMLDKSLHYKLHNNKALSFLQRPDLKDVGTKILTELAARYPQRNTFVRVLKLEPRLGEDKAPMAVMELIDSNYEIKFWFYAKIIARLQLQGVSVDPLTQREVDKLTRFRPNGLQVFADAVQTAKTVFFKYNSDTGQISDNAIKQNLKNLPRQHGYEDFVVSKKFATKKRTASRQGAPRPPPASPYLTAPSPSVV